MALNDRSIGIEIVNPGHEFGYRAFPVAQMQAVRALCQQIAHRHPIAPRNVVAHSDVAPNRKQDPGELFDWAFLAAGGVGVWPIGQAVAAGPSRPLASVLSDIGYDVTLPGVIAAFQRHWRAARVDGIADAETLGRAQAVRDLVQAGSSGAATSV